MSHPTVRTNTYENIFLIENSPRHESTRSNVKIYSRVFTLQCETENSTWLDYQNSRVIQQDFPFISFTQAWIAFAALTAVLALLLLLSFNHFSWIERRINFPIEMQASSFTTKFTMENLSVIAKPHRGSNTESNAKSDIVSIGQGSSSASNSILFAQRPESSCVFTRARASRHLVEFKRVDHISSKRDNSLSRTHIRPESLAKSRSIVSNRRKLPGRIRTACAALAKSSGWTEYSSYRWVVVSSFWYAKVVADIQFWRVKKCKRFWSLNFISEIFAQFTAHKLQRKLLS